VFSGLTSMRRFVLPVLVVLLVLGGVLTLIIRSAAPAARVTAASNQRAAARDADVLFGRLVLPPDARSSSREPSGSRLDTRGFDFPDPNKVDEHAWWVVPRPERTVVAFVKAHRPASAELEGEGWTGTGGIRTSSELQFQWPAIKSVLRNRSLSVQVAPLPGGYSAVRADA
jgi:hypothetical protein